MACLASLLLIEEPIEHVCTLIAFLGIELGLTESTYTSQLKYNINITTEALHTHTEALHTHTCVYTHTYMCAYNT